MFSNRVCSIAPQHVGMVRGFGGLMAAAFVVSLLSRRAYFRRVIDRDDEPAAYWIAVSSYFVLATFCLGGSVLCPPAA